MFNLNNEKSKYTTLDVVDEYFSGICEQVSFPAYEQYIIEKRGLCPYSLSSDCHDLNCVPLASGSSLDKYNISGEKSRMASSLSVFGSFSEKKKVFRAVER